MVLELVTLILSYHNALICLVNSFILQFSFAGLNAEVISKFPLFACFSPGGCLVSWLC